MLLDKLLKLVFLISVLLLGIHSYAQKGTGTLKGKVSDQSTKENIPFVSIKVQLNDTVVSQVTTDFDGNFLINGLKPGLYEVDFSFIGYQDLRMVDVEIKENEVTELKPSLTGGTELESVQFMYSKGVVGKGSLRRKHRRSRPGFNDKYGLTQGLHVGTEQNTEEYSDYNEVGYRSPIIRPFSTFSIDVDAASYSICRKHISNGSLPPQSAVRIEEMINYFNYDYPRPKDKTPFSVSTEYSECSWNKNHQLAVIAIKGKEIDTQDLPSSNLVFLLDVSGSMDYPNKLPLLKKSMKLLVNNLTKKDKISIVVYAGSAGVVLDPTPGNEKDEILDAIENLSAGGSTAGGEGIELAYELASEHFIKDGNNRIILATDGDFNVGISSESELQKFIEKKRESGIFLSVLGFGEGNVKDNKMERLADYGNGNYSYIDNLLEAQKVLISEMGGTLLTIAKDVKIQVEFNPEKVRAYRLIGYETRTLQDEDFNDDSKDAGELGAGQDVTALFEIIPADSDEEIPGLNIDSLKYQEVRTKEDQNFSNEILTVKLRYKLPKENKSKLLTSVIEGEKIPLAQSSDNLRFASAVTEYGMLLRNSEFKGNSNYNDVIQLAEGAKGEDNEGYISEFIRLAKLAKLLSQNEQKAEE